jgi:hypothetical protein
MVALVPGEHGDIQLRLGGPHKVNGSRRYTEHPNLPRFDLLGPEGPLHDSLNHRGFAGRTVGMLRQA